MKPPPSNKDSLKKKLRECIQFELLNDLVLVALVDTSQWNKENTLIEWSWNCMKNSTESEPDFFLIEELIEVFAFH